MLAAERTYAAWTRTGLAALASGIGARTLLAGVTPVWLAGATAAMLILFSGFAFLAGVIRELSTGALLPEHDLLKLPAGLLIAGNGFLVLVSLATLAGILMHN